MHPRRIDWNTNITISDTNKFPKLMHMSHNHKKQQRVANKLRKNAQSTFLQEELRSISLTREDAEKKYQKHLITQSSLLAQQRLASEWQVNMTQKEEMKRVMKEQKKQAKLARKNHNVLQATESVASSVAEMVFCDTQSNNFWNQETPAKKAPEVDIDDYCCPITLELFHNPVILSDGFTYEMHAIIEWLKNHNNSPMTGMTLEHKTFVSNISIKEHMVILGLL